jgi:hypothetical protein
MERSTTIAFYLREGSALLIDLQRDAPLVFHLRSLDDDSNVPLMYTNLARNEERAKRIGL